MRNSLLFSMLMASTLMAMESFYKEHKMRVAKSKFLKTKVDLFREEFRVYLNEDYSDSRGKNLVTILNEVEYEFDKDNLAFLEALSNLNDLVAVILFIEMAYKKMRFSSPADATNRIFGYGIFFTKIEQEKHKYEWNKQLVMVVKILIEVSSRLHRVQTVQENKLTGEFLLAIIKKVYNSVDHKYLGNYDVSFNTLRCIIEAYHRVIGQ